MGLQTKKILGIEVTTSSKKEILEEVQKYLEKVKSQKSKVKSREIKPFVIFTPNPEIINFAQKDSYFKQVVNTAQINLPDGIGVAWAIKKVYHQQIERISGADLMLDLCNLANKEGFIVGLIGGREGVALSVSECLLKIYPRLKIEVFDGPEVEISNIKNSRLSGIHDAVMRKNLQTALGQISKISIRQAQDRHIKNQKERDTKNTPGVAGWNVSGNHDSPGVKESENRYFNSLANEIKNKKTSILFVALGHPKQEYFISNLTYHLSLITYHNPLVLMAVGGSFDYISGRAPRAPKWIRERGLEWLYRLIKEPWRISRQLKGAEFFYKVLTTR